MRTTIKMGKLLILIILCLPGVLLAQNTRKITGRVVEASSGLPLPGATVFIDPENPESKDYNPAGTVADAEGRFELVLPVSIQYVVVSFIGYEALRADISGETVFTFRLKEDLKQLEEVVVTGYQKIEKRKITSAVTTVKAEDIQAIGVASIDQMLEGQVAGVLATPTNGAPGAPAKMRIRGMASGLPTTAQITQFEFFDKFEEYVHNMTGPHIKIASIHSHSC